jgi:hypothetical protein
MKPLNPSDVFWILATPIEVETWFAQLKKQGDTCVSFGDLEDARPFVVGLIRPGMDNRFCETIATKKDPMPVRLFLVGGRVIAFVLVKEVSQA